MLKRLALLLLLATGVFPCAADEPRGSGPLYSNSIYFPYILFAQLSGLSARIPEQGTSTLSGTLYLTNEMVSFSRRTNGVLKYYTVQDYENLTLELAGSHVFKEGLEAGISSRVLLYYGGFLDPVIEGFHSLFGFLNGGREHFDQHLVNIDVENSNGMVIRHSGTLLAWGDTELWFKTRLASSGNNLLSGLVTLKLPTGALSGSSAVSSGYPDLLVAALADLHVSPLFSFYLQTGYTFPLQLLDPLSTSRPMLCLSGLLAVEFHPLRHWSFIVQMNLKSGMLIGDVNHWYFKEYDRLLLPQTDLLFGVVLVNGTGRWQFFFTENFLTNSGADITFGVHYTYTIGRTHE